MRGVPGLFRLRDGHKPVVDTVYHLFCHCDGVVEIVLVLPDGVGDEIDFLLSQAAQMAL